MNDIKSLFHSVWGRDYHVGAMTGKSMIHIVRSLLNKWIV